jgi:O-antigen/teichoic acid export membrane protein
LKKTLQSLFSRKEEFERNVLTVFTGTTLAQAISILCLPILSRLYSPAEYGVYTLFISFSSIITSISGGKYEFAVMLPEKEEDGINLVALSSLSVFLVSLLSFGIFLMFNQTISNLLKSPEIEVWLYAVALMVLLGGLYSVLTFWNNRHKRFKRLSINRIVRSTAIALISTGLGFAAAGVAGLILGQLIGQAIGCGMLAWQNYQEHHGLTRQISWPAMITQSKRYRDFPKYQVPSGLLEVVAGQLPPLLFSPVFGLSVIGLFSRASSMVSMPMSLVAGSVREVFWQSASVEYSKSHDCRSLFVATFKKLLLLVLLPFLVIVLFGPTLFSFVLGERWEMAGVYAQIMSLMFALQFITNPLSCMFFIAEKQRLDLVLQTIFSMLVLVALLISCGLFDDPRAAIWAYTGVYSVKYLIELSLSYRFCCAGKVGR